MKKGAASSSSQYIPGGSGNSNTALWAPLLAIDHTSGWFVPCLWTSLAWRDDYLGSKMTGCHHSGANHITCMAPLGGESSPSLALCQWELERTKYKVEKGTPFPIFHANIASRARFWWLSALSKRNRALKFPLDRPSKMSMAESTCARRSLALK